MPARLFRRARRCARELEVWDGGAGVWAGSDPADGEETRIFRHGLVSSDFTSLPNLFSIIAVITFCSSHVHIHNTRRSHARKDKALNYPRQMDTRGHAAVT